MADRRWAILVACVLAVGCDKGKEAQKGAGAAASGGQQFVDEKISAEAQQMLGQIGKSMSAAFEAERMSDAVLQPGSTTVSLHKVCPSAKPVPAKIDDVKERAKYQSAVSDWKDAGWSCLKFAVDAPQYWQYEVKSDPDKGTFTAYARRKLGDQLIEYSLSGATQNGSLAIGPVTKGAAR